MTEGGKLHWTIKLGPFSAELYMGPPREGADEDMAEDKEVGK